MMIRRLAAPVLAGLLLVVLLPLAAPVRAATITVQSTADSGGVCVPVSQPTCTLRQAIADAAGGDTIAFSLALPATITLTTAELLIGKNLTLQGPGAGSLALDGGGAFRVLHVNGGAVVAVSGLTIQNGLATEQGAGVYVESGNLSLTGVTVTNNVASGTPTTGINQAGGLWNLGTLTLTDVSVTSNLASGTAPRQAGGIANQGTLSLFNTTVSNNSATGSGSGTASAHAGGIYNVESGTLNATNSTISGNTTSNAINPNAGGLYNQSAMTLRHVTIADNGASGSVGFFAANLRSVGTTASSIVANSIVANPRGAGANCANGPAISSARNNLEYPGTSCGFTQAGDRQDVDPLLTPLALNQPLPPLPTISVLTHALGANSPAVDAVTATPATATPGTPIVACAGIGDERGVPRPQTIVAARCDIGAFELQPSPMPTNTPTRTPTPTATATATSTATPTSTATSTPTSTATSTPTNTSTPATPPTGTLTSTPTATRTPTPTSTSTTPPTATSTAVPAACTTIGAVCHADLAPAGATGVGTLAFVSGPLAPGACMPAGRTNCVETRSTGSFRVEATITGLLPGDLVTIRIPVVDGAGVPQGMREFVCGTADAAGTVRCNGVVAQAGIVPQVGGTVLVLVTRLQSTVTPPPAATSVALLPFVPPPPPLLPPPPPPLPPPAVGPPGGRAGTMPPVGAPRAAPGVPVIPEADSLQLLLSALTGVGVLAGWHVRRRSR